MSVRDGFLLIDKPAGVSSFSVVRSMRSRLSVKKAGHAGTLDPQAVGLLVCAFGKATRLIRYLPLEPKVYEFTVTFGSRTDTLDGAGTVVASGGTVPSETALVTCLNEFTGPQMQVPPVFSALKVGGKRSYALARKGTPPDLQPRRIDVSRFTLLRYNGTVGTAEFSVTCSGGTYVRALARDIAEKLGTLGYASAIRRVRCGIFDVSNAYLPDMVSGTTPPLLIPEEVFHADAGMELSEALFNAVRHGKDIPSDGVSPEEERYVMAFYRKRLIAVLRKTGQDVFHPDLVYAAVEGGHADT